MKVSVICVADRPERAPLLYWSLVAQTHVNWEFILLDQSAEGDADKWVGGRKTVVRVPRRGDWGYAEKARAARELATGSVLLFPQDDAYYVPVALERFVATLNGGADLVLCGWLYDQQDYRPMPPVPAIGHVDVGGFAVRKDLFLSLGGWPSTSQQADGEFVLAAAQRESTRVALLEQTLYVKN